MADYGLRMYQAGYYRSYELRARNTASGETRAVTVYAKDDTAAYAEGFRQLDRESGDRAWCIDGHTVRE